MSDGSFVLPAVGTTVAGPQALALSPDDSALYVVNATQQTLVRMPVDGGEVTATASVGQLPRDVLVGPDGAVYVSQSTVSGVAGSSSVQVYPADLSTRRDVAITTTSAVAALAMSPQGSRSTSRSPA